MATQPRAVILCRYLCAGEATKQKVAHTIYPEICTASSVSKRKKREAIKRPMSEQILEDALRSGAG